MEPKSHLTLPVGVGKTLAETQVSSLDRAATATTLGATARGGLEDMGHASRILREELPL
jgi:hypothetical protein